MQELITQITGLDMALGLVLFVVYIWLQPQQEDSFSEGLDTGAAD